MREVEKWMELGLPYVSAVIVTGINLGVPREQVEDVAITSWQKGVAA